MQKRALALALGLSMLLLTACDTSKIAPTSGVIKESVEESIAAEESAMAEESIEQAEAIDNVEESSEEAEPEQVFRSRLSGEEITYNFLDHRPLAVMLNNIKEGCPQSGIEEASIVYECPVEGRITRLMGIFDQYEKVPKIGSIRSSRDYYVYLALEYDALYAHFGQATVYVGELLNSTGVDNLSGAVSGIERPANNTYYRSNDRKPPHNVYIDMEGLLKDREEFEYRTTYRTGFQEKFTYCDLGDRATFANGKDATVMYPGGKDAKAKNGFAAVQARFEYNKEDGKYYRYQYGDAHIDGETGNQLKYDNVVFQYCDGFVRDSKDYLAFGLLGDRVNKCQVFTDGKMVEGTWSRTEIYQPTKYYDGDGNEVVVNPGKTWICIIWNDYADDVVIE
ncbi:MAG: DUF3048 domain-containing protein [Lachnospiraceae bacterium]|nr:DUF3048 domain-containing protein [Candidatus Colinaster scatohippi]